MLDRKAPSVETPSEQTSETWKHIPWRKLERYGFRIQKRIFRASQQGNQRAVHKLQKLLMKSEAARTLAVRRVTGGTTRARRRQALMGKQPFTPTNDSGWYERFTRDSGPRKPPQSEECTFPSLGKRRNGL
jgi:hypothetical protein